MTDQNQDPLEQALQVCASEAIHQIGFIQPHGALLVLDTTPERIVRQASENLALFLGCSYESALGKPLVALLGHETAQFVEQLIQTASVKNTATGEISVTLAQGIAELDVHVCISGDFYVLEIAYDQGLPKKEGLVDVLLKMQQTLLDLDFADDTEEYFNQITQLVRSLTGYDSVMIYRFENNWDGEVIAQSRVEQAPSYLGSHFPASDIPPQARQLYTKNLVRIVADINAKSVPILPIINPLDQQPIDLTYSALRSLSPIHIEYLKNMGSQASMVISLLQKDRLWGLIACHHMAPKRVSIAMREATIFISRMISSKLGVLQMNEERKLLDQAALIKTELLKIILSHSAGDILLQLSDDLLELMDASGMIVVVEGVRYTYGEVLLPDATDALMDWLATFAPINVYSCDYLAKVFPAAEAYQSLVSGLITTSITSDMRNIIVWLRKDKPRSINWAGVYEQGLVKTHAGGYRLTPRTSFELWTEMWSGRCTPWKDVEIDIAHSLGQVLSDGLAEKNRNAIINNTPALIAYWQKNLLNVFSNQAFAKAFGAKFDSLQGRVFKDVVSTEFFRQSQASIDKVLQGIPSKIEYDVQGQTTDSVSHFLMEFVPNQLNHEIQGFYTLGFDITERKVMESQLKASELRFRNLANHVPVLIWTASVTQESLWFNNPWLIYSGSTLEKAVSLGWQDAFHPEDLPRYLQLLECQIDGDVSHIECRIRKYDGQYHWYDCHSIPLLTSNHELDGYLGVCIDLTQLRLSEKAIADAEKERYLRAELIQFIAMIGHELRTPLAIIDATVKSLGLLPGAEFPEVTIRHQHIIHSVRRLENLVTNVLARERFESGAWRLTRHIWPLFELMDSILATYQHALPENLKTGEICFQLDIPERSNSCLIINSNNYHGLISGDFQLLQIALSNLIDNACKYGDIDSTIKINCEICNGSIDIAVLNQGNHLAIQDLKRVFDKYWRGEEKTGVAGAGLGLYLVKHIVELHDGAIQVNNLSGRWIEFKMTLPLRPVL